MPGFPSSSLRSACLATAFAVLSPALSAAPVLEPVTEFRVGAKAPVGELVAGADGSFYGVTAAGGPGDFGTVYRVSPAGVRITLVEFTGQAGPRLGAQPQSALARGADGNFYGTTQAGGANNLGTIFRLTPAGDFTNLAEFTGNGGNSPGAAPYAALLAHPDGHFYGTTQNGGAGDFGTIFRVSPAGVVTTVVEFTGSAGARKGRIPLGALLAHPDGFLYGTTERGGAGDDGTIFRVSPGGALTTLFEFSVGSGRLPIAGLVLGADGSLYGSTSGGGGNSAGTIFKVTTAGAFTTLVQFSGSSPDFRGRSPSAPLLRHSNGNFYGTTQLGGTGEYGTVFQLTPSGDFTTLIQFTNTGGANRGRLPLGGLVEGSDGLLYGATSAGGGTNFGTLFRVSPGGNFQTLAEFSLDDGTVRGTNPITPLVENQAGQLLSVTGQGGSANLGTLYAVSPTGQFSALVEFTGTGGTRPGAFPRGALLETADGTVYGSTTQGGAANLGTIFRRTAAGNFTTLVEFAPVGLPRGAAPFAALTEYTDGNLYGSTAQGGASGFGTLFRMTPDGTLTTLVDFTNNGASNKGSTPSAALVLHPDGNFYGSTASGGAGGVGTLFRLTPAGVLTTLVEFTGATGLRRGSFPGAAFLVHSDGQLYGVTSGGGAGGFGTIFRVTTAGTLTTLIDFTGPSGANRGAGPSGSLVAPGDGNFYGVTQNGGSNSAGTIFRLTPGGTLTTLVDCTEPTGANPFAGLARHRDGNLYGSTRNGGSGAAGTIFRLRFGPTPQTLPAEPIQPTTATLRASVNPNGATTNVFFEYGTDPAQLNLTSSPQSLPASNAPVAVAIPIAGLQPSTGYYFRVRAENGQQLQPQRGQILAFQYDFPLSQLVDLTPEPGNGLRIRWQALPNQLYVIEYSDDLSAPWQSFLPPVAASNRGLLTFLDPTMPAPGKRAYRTKSAP